ncbi:MAG: flagellar biosynthetic protein FliR [Janthinobacterium lividum]
MIHATSAELYHWVALFLWPLARIMGLLTVAPLFGNVSVPARAKIALGVLLTIIISPGVPPLPASDPASMTGFLILIQQMLIGLAMGFAMRVVFAAIEMAGEVSGMTMGLSFASFFDPQTRGRTSVVSQFVALIALMLYLATNMHLVLLATLADSFNSLPISATPLNPLALREVANWGARIFSGGLQLALPIIAALLVTNLGLGVLTRAAPQLNLFGIGFPITLGVGFIMLTVTLPYLATPMQNLFEEGMQEIAKISAAAFAPPAPR